METRILGRTGRPVSVIGLGTWQLGADWGDVHEDDALGVLQAAYDEGVRAGRDHRDPRCAQYRAGACECGSRGALPDRRRRAGRDRGRLRRTHRAADR